MFGPHYSPLEYAGYCTIIETEAQRNKRSRLKYKSSKVTEPKFSDSTFYFPLCNEAINFLLEGAISRIL